MPAGGVALEDAGADCGKRSALGYIGKLLRDVGQFVARLLGESLHLRSEEVGQLFTKPIRT